MAKRTKTSQAAVAPELATASTEERKETTERPADSASGRHQKQLPKSLAEAPEKGSMPKPDSGKGNHKEDLTMSETAEGPADGKGTRRLPFCEIRSGRVRASLWDNSQGDATRWTVSFSRTYQKDGQWHRTTSFDVQDLPNLSRLAQEAEATIQKQKLPKAPEKDKEASLER